MPPRKPAAAGAHAGTGPPSAASSAGVMRLHTLAAIMTPAAKPKSALVKRSDMPWRMRNTSAAPRVFPRNGTMSATSTPATTGFSIAAKPKSALVKRSDMPWRMRNTSAAPRVFPRNGTMSATSTPATTGFSIAASFPTFSTAS